MILTYGNYPITQCWQATHGEEEEPRHMLKAALPGGMFGYLVFRCGKEVWAGYGSCSWTSREPPTCPECVEWYLGIYLKQHPLPFPNGYDEYGHWTYIPPKPPKWSEKLNIVS